MKPSVVVSLRLAGRFLLIWSIETVALLLLDTRFPDLGVRSPFSPVVIFSSILVALTLSIINTLIQPLIILTRMPLNVFTISAVAIVINNIVLRIAAARLAGFDVEPFFPTGIAGALAISLINIVLTALIALDDEYAFFQFAMHVLTHNRDIRRAITKPAGQPGMIFIQLDGLSPQRLKDAVNAGYMPTVKAMLNDGAHLLTTYDCGLPSQTSACQAGIMYGQNPDIPGFRWFDKKRRRMVVSNHVNDAAMINKACSTGAGILYGGSSINNLINGDASKSLLTLSTLNGVSGVRTERAIDDLSSFWFNPYTFTRTLAGSIGDFIVEVIESTRQFLLNEQPHIDRIFNGQVFMRVLTNIFLRDLSAYVVMLDIYRGLPAIYTTFMGYDQVAHHAGPDSRDALRTLIGLDKHLRHILQAMERLSTRPYQLYLLSDHGQSFGPTFRQRYSLTLRDLVDRLTSKETFVEETQTEGDKLTYSAALILELNAASEQLAAQPKTAFRRAVIRQVTRQLSRSINDVQTDVSPASHIIVCASGNLANLYFASAEGKLPLSDIERLHPNLIQDLARHAGVGIIAGYADNGDVIAIGKSGARNLYTGAVTGTDPLIQYGDPQKHAEQILRIAQFQNAGDLILNSPVFEDGTVASFEDLIGVHGGIGGQQTDAFIISPSGAGVNTAGIISATQVFSILDRQRARNMASQAENLL